MTKNSKSKAAKSPVANKTQEFEKSKLVANMIANAITSRLSLAGTQLDPRRDIDAECGYPKNISSEQYEYLYAREGIAERVVNIFPEESWSMDPTVHDSEIDTKDSTFNEAITELDDTNNIFSYLERADKLSGVGCFGVILLGLSDGQELSKPVEGVNEKTGEITTSKEHKLTFLRVFDQSLVEIKTWVTDQSSPRFGQPESYNLGFASLSQANSTQTQVDQTVDVQVHWSRIIHLADNRQTSEICGVPRLQKVYNRIYDLRKILSGSGEMFWKGAFPGLSLETAPDVSGDVEFDQESLDDEMASYQNGLKRYLALAGVSVKSLAPQVSDPTAHAMINLKFIAISLGIPFRVFVGSEEAQLAGAQDALAWNKRLKRRQDKYVSPLVVRPFIDRLIAFNILPPPAQDSYEVTWPDLNTVTDDEKAKVAKTKTEALKLYSDSATAQTFVPPKEFLTLFLGLTESVADELLEAAMGSVGGEDEPIEDVQGIEEP